MSNLGKKVLLYRTDISGKTPNISDVAIGELSLNYNANSPFLAFKDTNDELQKIGALSNNTGDSEFVTMSQKAITEAIELNPHGGYIYIEKFDRENLQNALKLALESLNEGEDAILDCTYFKGSHTITEGFQINNPVKLIFGGIDITYDNIIDTNLFTFNCNNISIEGLNRNTDKSQVVSGSTIFRMINSDSTLNGYHIKSRGNKNIEIKNITLVGKRTTLGHQYNNNTYPIDGVGGIYIEKSKPEVIEASNTCNNTRIENVLIAGTKSHGIYIDTPILSTFKNIRLSDCGGHGIFINNGTSILLENVYSSSANMAGFCIYGASYVSLNNCVSENSGIGFWIRSAFNVTLMNPGVEETNTCGKNPWKLSQPISGKYGLGLTTLHSNGTDVVNISDVNSDYYEYFIGYGILISGGKSINVFTPYIKSIGNSIVTEAYSGGTELSSSLKYINVVGNARAIYILNPSFKEKSDSLVPTTIRHEIGISNEVENIELIYDTTSTILQGTLDSTTYVSNSDLRAPIYCKTTSCVIRNGKNLITNYHYSKLPTENSELTNKEYVDSLIDDIIAGENANLANYYTKLETYNKEEVNELVNNLDIDHKLSETYESVTYPSVEDTDGVEFIAAKANDDLDTVVSNLDRNVSTLVQEVLNNEEVTAAAITEIKESVGLDENLKYVVNTETTYINNATSFAEADNLLDAAISNIINEIPSLDDYATKEYVTSQLGNVDLSEINEQLEEANNKISLLETQLSAATSTISTLESKLDAIIRAVGLNSDGTFIVPTIAQTSGYTTAATSVMSAIHLIDNQIEENETVTAYALTDLNNRLEELDSKITDFEKETNIN